MNLRIFFEFTNLKSYLFKINNLSFNILKYTFFKLAILGLIN
jgi:hypothetical protein